MYLSYIFEHILAAELLSNTRECEKTLCVKEQKIEVSLGLKQCK